MLDWTQTNLTTILDHASGLSKYHGAPPILNTLPQYLKSLQPSLVPRLAKLLTSTSNFIGTTTYTFMNVTCPVLLLQEWQVLASQRNTNNMRHATVKGSRLFWLHGVLWCALKPRSTFKKNSATIWMWQLMRTCAQRLDSLWALLVLNVFKSQ